MCRIESYEVCQCVGLTPNGLDQDYKVRVDYLGQQFWSAPFNGVSEIAVEIAHGYADIHVTDLGIDVEGASVYLFTESGSYLGRMQPTDAAGNASFLMPAGAYKFRVDHGGNQYWSDVMNVMANEATPVPMPLDLLALDGTLNPHPQRFDGTPPEYIQKPVYLASLLNITGILVNSVVAATSNDAVYYYINDHLGTPQKMIDTEGNVVWEADIKPFGLASIRNENIKNQFRLLGQYLDTETRMHYNHNRYYNPRTGRYITADPIGLEGGINLYLYTSDNSINLTDPYGLYWLYSQSTGQLSYVNEQGPIGPMATPVAVGYSGNGSGLNNPYLQNVKNVGPIPVGDYTIGEQQNIITSTGVTLNAAMLLTQDESNNMFDRDDFVIHGDNSCGCQSASKGCIVLPLNIRNMIANSGDTKLKVIPGIVTFMPTIDWSMEAP